MAIAFVNGVNRTSSGSGSGPNFPMPAFNCSAGNFLFLAVGYDRQDTGAGTQPTAVTDTAGNTYTRLGGQTYAGNNVGTINWYYAKNTLAHATNVITINIAGFTAGIDWHEAAVVQWSGVDTVDPIIQHSDWQLNATNTNRSPSVTSAEESVFLASVGWWHDALSGNSSGYTNREVSANGDALQIDSLASASGETSFCTWTASFFFEDSTKRAGACTTAIRAAGGGGAPTVYGYQQGIIF